MTAEQIAAALPPRKKRPPKKPPDVAGALAAPRGQPLPVPLEVPLDLREAVALWNVVAWRHHWGQVGSWTAERKEKFPAVFEAVGRFEGWKLLLERCEASDFLLGKTERDPKFKNWVFGFDQLFREKFLKTLTEGGYDNAQREVRLKQERRGYGGLLVAIEDAERG